MFEKVPNQKVRGYIRRDEANVFDGRCFNESHNQDMTLDKLISPSLCSLVGITTASSSWDHFKAYMKLCV